MQNVYRKLYCDGCGYCQEHCECGPNDTPSPCSGKIVGSCKKCSSHTAPQPPSIPNDRRSVTELVIEDLNERMAHGIQKYKTPLQPFNGRNALIDAYQECLDQVLYIKQILIQIDAWTAMQPEPLSLSPHDCASIPVCILRGQPCRVHSDILSRTSPHDRES